MKRYVRSANKFTNKATQLVSKGFTDKYIEKKSQGSRKGETMEQIFNNIMNDPNIEFGDADKSGNQTIFYKGKNVGWINFNRGTGWIDEKEYFKLEKYVAPEEDEEYIDEEDYEEYDDDDIDACDKI